MNKYRRTLAVNVQPIETVTTPAINLFYGNWADSRTYCDNRFIDALDLGNQFSASTDGHLGYCMVTNHNGTWSVTHANITLTGSMYRIFAYILRTFW